MWLNALALFFQTAGWGMVPPIHEHSSSAMRETERSDRVSVTCRDTGPIIAEFKSIKSKVSVVSIQGLSHQLSNAERDDINARLQNFEALDRANIACIGDGTAVVQVLGDFALSDSRSSQKNADILVDTKGVRVLPK